MTKEQTRRRFRHGIEDAVREALTNPPHMPATEREARRPSAEAALASVDALELAYMQDRNPVHVWDAITQIHYAAPILDVPVHLPNWVLAYVKAGAIIPHGSG